MKASLAQRPPHKSGPTCRDSLLRSLWGFVPSQRYQAEGILWRCYIGHCCTPLQLCISKGGHYQVQCYKENIIGRGKKLDAQKSVTLYGAGIYSFVLVETGVITAQSLQVFWEHNCRVLFHYICFLSMQRNLSERVFQQRESRRCQEECRDWKQKFLLSGYRHFCLIIQLRKQIRRNC